MDWEKYLWYRRKFWRSYYDSPDGTDCFKKIGVCTSMGLVAGGVIAVHNALLISAPVLGQLNKPVPDPVPYSQILRRFGYFMLPLGAMGATFAAVTCAATTIRKKDDQWNYFIGGYSTGIVLGAWSKVRHGIIGGFWIAVIAAIRKDFKMKGWELFPRYIDDPIPRGNLNFVHRGDSFRWLEDVPRNWKTPEEVEESN